MFAKRIIVLNVLCTIITWWTLVFSSLTSLSLSPSLFWTKFNVSCGRFCFHSCFHLYKERLFCSLCRVYTYIRLIFKCKIGFLWNSGKGANSQIKMGITISVLFYFVLKLRNTYKYELEKEPDLVCCTLMWTIFILIEHFFS